MNLPLTLHHERATKRPVDETVQPHPIEDGQPRRSNIEMIQQSDDWSVAQEDAIAPSAGKSLHRSPATHGILEVFKRLS